MEFANMESAELADPPPAPVPVVDPVPMVVDSSSPPVARSQGHVFIFDADLKSTLEARAMHMPAWDKGQLARVARENYRLVQQGYYVDGTSGTPHSIELPSDAINRAHRAPPPRGRPLGYKHALTRLTIARIDTASCARAMHDLNEPAACLNFANAFSPGGGYLHGARAQEEDLCRLMPPLYSSLLLHKYPIKEHEAFFTRTWLCRRAGNYYLVGPPVPVDVITAAMPNLNTQHGGPAAKLKARGSKWTSTVRLRIRAVLHAARDEGCDAIILGAFGCGAFANPPDAVAKLFAECLASDEFRGAFATVIFAILEPKTTDSGNIDAFANAMLNICAEAPTTAQ